MGTAGRDLLNPSICLGEPCLKGTRIATQTLWALHAAGDSAERIAESYEVEVEKVGRLLPGNRSSDTTGRTSPFFYYDEGLSPKIGEILAHVSFSVEVGPKGLSDEALIAEMGRKGQAWITKDDRARVEHEAAIVNAGISIVFLRDSLMSASASLTEEECHKLEGDTTSASHQTGCHTGRDRSFKSSPVFHSISQDPQQAGVRKALQSQGGVAESDRQLVGISAPTLLPSGRIALSPSSLLRAKGRHVSGQHRSQGRQGAQPQEHRRHHPQEPAGRHHRRLRLRQSSLAFDTIYAEGQRRYVESLSAYARQFLGRMEKPTWSTSRAFRGHIHRPEGRLPQPALHRRHRNRDLRLPAAPLRPGRRPHCYQCGRPVGASDCAADS